VISLDLLNNAHIIDCHVHDVHKNGDVRVEFPTPFIPEIMCKKNHIVRCSDYKNGHYTFACIQCGKKTVFERDPYFNYNIKLLRTHLPNEIVFPLVTISPGLNEKIKKYEMMFPHEIIGYKLHPNFSNYYLTDLCLDSSKILIIHCGVGSYDNAELIIDFAERYLGPVIIAHLGRLSEGAFNRARKLKNIFFDCSSIGLIWKSYLNNSYNLCNSDYLGHFDSPVQLLASVISYVGEDKIIFGSDEPYGSFAEDIAIVENLNVRTKNKLMSQNLKKLIMEQINV